MPLNPSRSHLYWWQWQGEIYVNVSFTRCIMHCRGFVYSFYYAKMHCFADIAVSFQSYFLSCLYHNKVCIFLQTIFQTVNEKFVFSIVFLILLVFLCCSKCLRFAILTPSVNKEQRWFGQFLDKVGYLVSSDFRDYSLAKCSKLFFFSSQ